MTSRVPGLSNAVVNKAEHSGFQELVKKIESRPHRAALQSDVQQNNIYNPFSEHLKEMVHELGNVELFELCETIPKIKYSHCLPWNQGIVYCICGHYLIYSECRSFLNRQRLVAISFRNYCDQERRYPWCSTRQDRRTERVPYRMECVEEMLQESRLSR